MEPRPVRGRAPAREHAVGGPGSAGPVPGPARGLGRRAPVRPGAGLVGGPAPGPGGPRYVPLRPGAGDPDRRRRPGRGRLRPLGEPGAVARLQPLPRLALPALGAAGGRRPGSTGPSRALLHHGRPGPGPGDPRRSSGGGLLRRLRGGSPGAGGPPPRPPRAGALAARPRHRDPPGGAGPGALRGVPAALGSPARPPACAAAAGDAGPGLPRCAARVLGLLRPLGAGRRRGGGGPARALRAADPGHRPRMVRPVRDPGAARGAVRPGPRARGVARGREPAPRIAGAGVGVRCLEPGTQHDPEHGGGSVQPAPAPPGGGCAGPDRALALAAAGGSRRAGPRRLPRGLRPLRPRGRGAAPPAARRASGRGRERGGAAPPVGLRRALARAPGPGGAPGRERRGAAPRRRRRITAVRRRRAAERRAARRLAGGRAAARLRAA